MKFAQFTALTPQQTLNRLNVTKQSGLAQQQATEMLAKQGPNSVKTRQTSALHILIRQFKSIFIYILLFSAGLVFMLGEKIDAAFILFFVGMNVLLGFFQEYKSEKTTQMLKKYTNKRTTVIRDGAEQLVEAQTLVPGDIVVIETGDIIPADLRLIEVNALLVDESMLSGESVQVTKTAHEAKVEQHELFNATNIAFSGSIVVEGKGIGVVIATGKDTEFGKVAKLTTQTEEVSSFEKQINKFSKFILILIIITLIFVFVVQALFKDSISIPSLLLYSIALAVGVIPEAMPLVTTFSLSIGAEKLAKKKVIVKRLSAIEDLGGIQILCTDKTGTLTQNKLTVADFYTQSIELTLYYALLCASSTDKHQSTNNAFDLALLAKTNNKYDQAQKNRKTLYELPFNPNKRKNSVLLNIDGQNTLIIRGAVESILPYTTNLSQQKTDDLINWVLAQGNSGRRVIAIAKKLLNMNEYSHKDEENNLELVGLISFEDPIKDSTIPAINKAKANGISFKMITGDSAEVALAVGKQVGIATHEIGVMTGDEFAKLDMYQKKQIAQKINVFARMSPEQKYDLITLLQEDAEVGYLGDGINDGPALKAAGVSIVVDSASDVAKEVTDIILLEKDLSTIIDGIELGRKTFVNVTNYIKATLASNFGNFYAMAFVTLIIDYLPMLPLQILLVNLLSDLPMISIATDNVSANDIKKPQGFAFKELILLATVLGLVSTTFDFMMFGIFKNLGESQLQTYWFIGSILTELVLIYSIRTKKWFFKTKNLPSMPIIFITVVAALITVALPFTNVGVQVFKFVTPQWNLLFLVFSIVLAYFLCTEIIKKTYYKYFS